MGKGGGCFPSKNKIAKTTNKYANSATKSTSAADTTVLSPTKNLKVFIVFYSMYGHVESLAKRMKKGVDTVDGVEGVLYRVPETLSEDVLVHMQAPPKDDNILELPSPLELADADGFLFGLPTRYGCMAAQMKAFFNSTGLLWKEQKLAGKPAGFFVSTGSQGGGQETTAWTAITQLAHHGMLFVPIGYTFGADMFDMDSIRGGSPYGAGVFAGDGSRKATETELALAEYQGKYMAAVVKKLAHV
ncbi:probable NAD(P)H dehydrogenase (quinone) FQR1-like 2 [Nicotiana sylvestris]|uniref:NAD(P)H dehydrogenase (quinone) n=1 Tax=Nicotiana sylvestris TaxID=4096 RepID=A0A1U7XCQ3_NICSY|nr:PREDICTED: minor allergen Alt a 7-like [Nicotiana sylvestris]